MMGENPDAELRPACPDCGSVEVTFYGSGIFRVLPDLIFELVDGELNSEPDGDAACDCGWEGIRDDLVVPPGGIKA